MVAQAAPRKPKRLRNASASWPLVKELAVQTLYLTDGLSPKQIAASLSSPSEPVTHQAIRSLIFRRGWTPQRRNKIEQAETFSLARSKEHIERVVNAQAAVAEAASVAGLKRALDVAQGAGSSTDKDVANSFRAWAGGTRDLVNIMRQARGLDSRELNGASQPFNLLAVGTINFGVAKEPMNVTPSAPSAQAVEAPASPPTTASK